MEGNWNARIAPSLTNIGVAVVCCAVLWFVLPLGYEQHGDDGNAPLFDLMVRGLDGDGAVVNAVNFGLICLVSFLVLRMVERFSLFATRTILPATFCATLLPIVMCRSELYAGYVITLLTILVMFSAHRLSDTFNQIHAFNIGALTVIGELFFTYFIVLVVPIISYLLFCDAFKFRTLLAMLIGIIITAAYSVGLLMLLDIQNVGDIVDLRFGFSGLDCVSNWEIYEKVFYGLLVLLLVFSIIRLGAVYDIESLKRRSVYTLCANEFFLSCFLLLFTAQGLTMLLVNAISLGGIFIGGYFTVFSAKNRVCKVLGMVVCALVVVFVGVLSASRLM